MYICMFGAIAFEVGGWYDDRQTAPGSEKMSGWQAHSSAWGTPTILRSTRQPLYGWDPNLDRESDDEILASSDLVACSRTPAVGTLTQNILKRALLDTLLGPTTIRSVAELMFQGTSRGTPQGLIP